jgi:undecaprenyl-diphosphatase
MITGVIEAIILGIVQGITEFLPVSSTGHLTVLQTLFGLDQKRFGLSFDMFTTLGTTLALIFYFRKDLWSLILNIRLRPKTHEQRLVWWIIGVTVIVGLAGLLLEDMIATSFRSLPLIAAMLVLFGAVMLFAEYVASHKPKGELTPTRAYGVGLAQILAFIPGVSRSGATISTGLLLGLSREQAARYSFLLSAPITLAAIAKRSVTALAEFRQAPLTVDERWFYIIGFIAALIAGYYSIRFLLQYLAKYSLAAFAYYRFGLAAVIVLYLAIR